MTTQPSRLLIVTGDPVTGLRFIGPVKANTPLCDEIIDHLLAGAEWWLAPIDDPADLLPGTDRP